MRYTKKITKNYGCKMNDYMWKDNSYNHSRLGIDKLGQLEDIEEELGFDMLTFFKLMNGNIIIYVKNGLGEIEMFGGNGWGFQINLVDKAIILNRNYYLKDYGKTWAFTKEELKNDRV